MKLHDSPQSHTSLPTQQCPCSLDPWVNPKRNGKDVEYRVIDDEAPSTTNLRLV